jgi:dolichol kinase
MMKKETDRKIFHVLSGVIPFGVYFMPEGFGFTSRQMTLIVLGGLSIPFICLDVGRRWIPFFQKTFKWIAGHSMRESEELDYQLTGATWQLISFWLVLWYFKPDYSVPACLLLSISDAAAALVGKRWGKVRWIYNHTLMGTGAFILTGMLIFIIGYPHLVLWKVFIVVVLTSICEALLHRVNDNFSIPLISATLLAFLQA